MRRAARRLGVVLAAVALMAGCLVVGSLLSPAGGGQVPGGPPPGSRPRRAVVHRAAGVSVVANVRGATVAVYRRPAAGARRRTLRAAHAGTPLVLLVRGRRPGWLRVLLPLRPNGAVGWIRTGAAVLRANPFHLVVVLHAHVLVVWRRTRVLLRAPIGVGRAATPTPRGLAYVTVLLRQPDPRGIYGPWAFGLSVYSPVLTSFGGGPGQVGIHGTDAPAGLGHDVSHGCIRVRNATIERLARILPLGTPVRIAS